MSRLGISFLTDKPYSDYAALGKVVDSFDFETISVYEDLFYQPAWPALLQFAQHTKRPLIGPAVVNPYLVHPVTVAANMALLDDVSQGRAYLGVGKGAFFKPIDVAQPKPITAIREMIEVVQRFLVGNRDPYQGKFFRVDPQAYLRFKIPERKLPVLIGSWGEKTSALAGRIADMLKVGGCANPESAPVFKRYLEAGARKAGRHASEIRLVFGAVTVIDRDRRVAEELARRRAAMYVNVTGRLDPTYRPPDKELTRIEEALARGDMASAAAALSKETLRRFCCFGTPSDIVRQLEELFAAGVDIFELGSPHGIDQAESIRMLGEKVLPAFK
jgi:5,10-methylenetetrahydromethanopterin reductase